MSVVTRPGVQRRRQQSRQCRFEKWERARRLHGQGYFKKDISRLLGLDVHTVRNYLRTDTFPERKRGSTVNWPLTPYKEFILGRWEEGCQNALQLWRESKARGYPGSATAVRDFVFLRLRVPAPSAGDDACPKTNGAGCSLAAHLVLAVGPTCAAHSGTNRAGGEAVSGLPTLAASRDLALSFQDMMRRRAADGLESWLERASASGLSCFASFARGLRAAVEAAVEAACALEWSNGPTEGNVNRLKLIKRQSYGRASFGLLKARVLPLAA